MFYKNRTTAPLLGLLAALPLILLLAATLPATPDIMDQNGHLIRETTEPSTHPPATCIPDMANPHSKDLTVEGLLNRLPAELTPIQATVARDIIMEAAPRLRTASARFNEVCDKLEALSFSTNTPPESLGKLGRELSQARKDLRRELLRVNGKVKQATGVDPQWDQSFKAAATK